MKKFLKFLVLFLAVIILCLFSITIVTLIKKYNNKEFKIIEGLKISPVLADHYKVLSFEIDNRKLYLNLEDQRTNILLIKIYDINNGNEIGEITLN